MPEDAETTVLHARASDARLLTISESVKTLRESLDSIETVAMEMGQRIGGGIGAISATLRDPNKSGLRLDLHLAAERAASALDMLRSLQEHF